MTMTEEGRTGLILAVFAPVCGWAAVVFSNYIEVRTLDNPDFEAETVWVGDSLFVHWPKISPVSWEYVNLGQHYQNIAEPGWTAERLLRWVPDPVRFENVDTIHLSVGGADLNTVSPPVAAYRTTQVVETLLRSTEADIVLYTLPRQPGRDVDTEAFNEWITAMWPDGYHPRVTVVHWPEDTVTWDGRHPDATSYSRLVGLEP
jgi:hypothetical protein